MNQLRCASYIRVSTDEQAREGVSLDAQEEYISSYAKSQGWEITGVFREEYTGTSLKRPQLDNMIASIKSGKFDIVLVYKLDRLSRRQRDVWHLLEDVFESHGVGFKSITEPFETTTATGKAFLGMLAVFAQLERDTVVERTKAALNHKKKQGQHCGRVPYGYRVGSDKKLQKHPNEQKNIARMKRLRRSGFSYREISRRVNIPYRTVHKLLNEQNNSRNSYSVKETQASVVQ